MRPLYVVGGLPAFVPTLRSEDLHAETYCACLSSLYPSQQVRNSPSVSSNFWSAGRWPSVPTSCCQSRKASPSCRMPASSQRQVHMQATNNGSSKHKQQNNCCSVMRPLLWLCDCVQCQQVLFNKPMIYLECHLQCTVSFTGSWVYAVIKQLTLAQLS
jgi:hypothetical protein